MSDDATLIGRQSPRFRTPTAAAACPVPTAPDRSSMLNDILRRLPQKLGVLIGETVNACTRVDGFAWEQDGVEHAGGQVRARQRRMAFVLVVQDRRFVFREKT